MRIFLVRHGQSQANVDGLQNALHADASIPLTDEGHGQAQEVGSFLAEWFNNKAEHTYPLIRLWHSPYKRAVQTAEHIEAACVAQPCRGTEHKPRKLVGHGSHVGPVRNPGDCFFLDRREHFLLREQEHGVFDGLSDEEREREYPAEWSYYQKHKAEGFKILAQLPLGESRIQVATRVHQAFGTFQRDNDMHGINNLIVVGHGTTNRCFVFAWLHKPLTWLEDEPNPWNCSVRLLEDGDDKGYIFKGFQRGRHAGQ